MGIQINGQTDNISAVDGSLTIESTELRADNINLGVGVSIYSFSDNSLGISTNGISESFTMTSSGSFGIGTTLPSSRLQVDGGGVPLIINSTNSNNNKITLQSAGVTSCFIGAGSGLEYQIQSSGGPNRFVIDSNKGNVGIGPLTGVNNIKLYVYNTDVGYAAYFESIGSSAVYGAVARIANGTSSGYGLYGYSNTSSSYSTGGVLGYSINNNTYAILGYWDTSSYWSLYGNGSTYISGTYQGSDGRLKDIVEPLVSVGSTVSVLDKLSNISAVKYRWKEGSQQRRSMGDNVHIGLIAQEVEEYFPELIREVDNPVITGVNPETLNEQLGSTKSLQYNNMVAVLVEALKESKERIEILETKVSTLESKII